MKDEIRPSGGGRALQSTATASPTLDSAASKADIATLADAAYVMGVVVGSDRPLEEVMALMRKRVEALRDPMSAEAAAELQRQMVLLDCLFQRFAEETTRTRKGSVHQTMLLRAALQAQQAYARSFALLHTLAAQAKGATKPPAIRLHDDDPADH